jgi:hypothetical protein
MPQSRCAAARIRSPAQEPADFVQRKPACACGATCPRCSGGAPARAKLAVSQPGDALEQEADRVADTVLRMPAVEVARRGPGEVRRWARRGARRDAGAPVSLALGSGMPLPAADRAFFEARFGEDFSAVRLHADRAAGEAALGFDARAFTLGRNIAFAPGEYAPGTTEGRRLLAHELAHVVQQGDQAAIPPIQRKAYAGCSGVKLAGDDAEATIDRSRAEGLRLIATARAAFPRMSGRTIGLLDRHFHCPGTAEIRTIIAGLAAIEKAIPAVEARCFKGKGKFCEFYEAQVTTPDAVLEICNNATLSGPGGLGAHFVWAAAIVAGMDNDCKSGWWCYDDFMVPATEMVKHASAYTQLVVELAGLKGVKAPPTVPCRPFDTHTYVSVPIGGANPRDIKPVSGHETPAPYSQILTVYKDAAGHEFVYTDDFYGAEQFMPGEPKRYYLSKGIWPIRELKDL